LKRSNRLFILAGILLAAVAFVAVLLLGGGGGGEPPPPPTVTVVVATQDIGLGTQVAAEMVTTEQRPEAQATDSFSSVDEVVGKIMRRPIQSGQVFRTQDFETTAGGISADAIPAGQRAIAVPLDKITSVGYLVQPGDFVDVVLTVRDERGLSEPYSDADGMNPIIGPSTDNPDVYDNKDNLMNNTSVKVLVQSVQVLAVLRPTVATDPNAPAGDAAIPREPTMVAVLAVSPQEAELVRWAELDGNISLLLRPPADVQAEDVATTGVTLRLMVDQYGVLPPGPVTTQPLVPIQPLP
jgi:pilus assembly protein CpaB